MSTSLKEPIFEVEVIEFIEPYMLAADGIKLSLQSGDIQFTCNYCFSPYSAMTTNDSVDTQLIREKFFPGRKIWVEADLTDPFDQLNCIEVFDTNQFGIKEIGYMKWEVCGQVQSDEFEDMVIVDCGVPITAFAMPSLEIGKIMRWVGELKVYQAAN